MAYKIIGNLGEPHEMNILPGWTTSKTTHDKVDLSVELVPDVELSVPFIGAAMTSVVNERLLGECARNGAMAVVPSQYPIEVAKRMVENVKKNEVRRGDLEFVEQPEWINVDGDASKVGDAIDRYNKVGHSVIPICDDERKLKGLFRYREGIPNDCLNVDLHEAIGLARSRKNEWGKIVIPFDIEKAKNGEDYVSERCQPKTIQNRMKKARKGCMPVVDRNGVMKGLTFNYMHNGYAVGGAIHTYKWEKRAEALLEAGADIIFIDASDGASDFQVRTLRKFKRLFPDSYICAGNVVATTAIKKTRSGKLIEVPVYDTLVEAGADLFKVGMGSGRMCLTTDNRGVGGDILRALYDFYKAREKLGVYRPMIADGGIGTLDPDFDKRVLVRRNLRQDTRSINAALAFADAAMMGTYFNMFEEAAGPVHNEGGILYIENWGEGSYKARSFARYDVGEGVRRADIEEGGFYLIPLVGRLKPGMEKTALGVAMTMSNVGAANLHDYREMCVLEGLY
ncbi:MAG: IMP dehydrogenase [Candidatus Aenigmarchaeota archaeon]|nr:IMP dehydrogenase [Candidatus Aenigmarchaeota archaeon]